MAQSEVFSMASYEKLPMLSTDSFDLEANHFLFDSETEPPTEVDGDPTRPHQDSTPSVPKTFRLPPRVLSDSILGLSDGMTVPFALTASLSALGDTRVVVLAGLAELIAGAISMGLGGYLAAKSEAAVYAHTRRALEHDIDTCRTRRPSTLPLRISSAFARYEIPATLLGDLVGFLSRSEHLAEFLLRFECGMGEPEGCRAVVCALTIAGGYFVGGFIPLLPYLLVRDREDVETALWASVVTMVVTLFLLGYGKTCLITASGSAGDESSSVSVRVFGSVKEGIMGGLQMLVIGGLSAGCAVILVKSFNSLM